MGTKTAQKQVQEKWIDKITALLAKAESTEFPEERASLLAKAQELMTRYEVDEALINAGKKRSTFKIVSERVNTPGPYTPSKQQLLHLVGKVNGVRVISIDTSPKDPHCYMVGTESDVQYVKALFASLLLQSTSEMMAKETEMRKNIAGLKPAVRKHEEEFVEASDAYAIRWPRVYRPNFLIGYAHEVHNRLVEAKNGVVETYSKDDQNKSALVLSKRNDAVDAEYKKLFPSTTVSKSQAAVNGAARNAGRAAGKRADLGQNKVGGRKAINA